MKYRNDYKKNMINKRTRLIVHCSHHKAGTHWFQKILLQMATRFGLKFQYSEQEQPEEDTDIFFQVASQVDFSTLRSYRGSHIIRDPRDVVISGYFYHLWCQENWCRQPKSYYDNRSYQEVLNALPQEEGIALEMKTVTRWTIRNMIKWDYSNPNIIEVKYEELIKDEEAGFDKIFQHYGLSEAEISESLDIVRQHTFKQMAKRQPGQEDRNSIFRKGISGDWKNYFTSEHIQLFEELFPGGLVKLGYSWEGQNPIKSYFKIGNQLKRNNKLNEAISAYKQAVEQNPNFYASYHNLGEVLTQQGHFQESIAAYRRAIALNPNSAWSYHGLGEVLLKQDDTEEAIAAYRHAIELKPDVTDFQKSLKEAIAAHRRAIEINPNLPPKTTYYNAPTFNDRWIVEYVFPGKRKGYFFEAGAANGRNCSSCFVLEKELDWTGICVEPNSHFFQELIGNRPKSICENICLANRAETVNYIEGSPNTISPYLGGIKENLEKFRHDGSNVVELGQEVQKQALTMEAVLKKHQAPKIIDYAAFDIEGSELPVLEVFPFDEYLILALSIETGGVAWSKIYELLLAKGYVEVNNPFNRDKHFEKYVLHHSIL
jgi:tetratricopeptide (TPR) repeat protein